MNIQALSNSVRVSFSPLEFSLATGLSISTVRRRLAAGEIRFARSGRRVLIPSEELKRLTTPQSTAGEN